MSLSFSTPTSTKRGRFPQQHTPGNDHEEEEDDDEFHTPNENAFSPLPNTTILGQLNQQYSTGTSTLRQSNGEAVTHSSDDTTSNSSSAHLPQHLQHPKTTKPEPEPHVQETIITGTTSSGPQIQFQHYYVLPVLLLEFLAIALTRAVLPSILIEEYGSNVYVVLGIADCIRGILAFFACPLFGKLSDALGRKICLFVTVLGSCAPVCSLAFFTWDDATTTLPLPGSNADATAEELSSSALPPMAIPLFVVLLSFSGLFSSTFPLVFAYISDSVQERNERVTAYGLALATFGLSFTIGPMAGGYLANSRTDYVFRCSLVLTLLDLLYIYAVLPESISPRVLLFAKKGATAQTTTSTNNSNTVLSSSSSSSVTSMETRTMLVQIADSISWNPWDSIRLVLHDPFLRKVGQVAFFYYTGLWAVISTLSLYAVQHFKMDRQTLGELMSALGLSTMVAEAVLVRFLVPLVGERRAIRIGLISFGLQCFVLGAANESWQLFFCVALSLLGNLVYPSLSSLVSGIVEPENVGEALGAINGIKALTEGLGPLIFGTLMTFSEHTAFPGSPYWLAGIFVLIAHHLAAKLPANSDPTMDSWVVGKSPAHHHSSSLPPEREYIHELEFKRRYPNTKSSARRKNVYNDNNDDDDDCLGLASMYPTRTRDEEDEEYQGLLSEVDEDTDEWEAATDASGSTSEINTNEIRGNHEDLDFARKPVQS
jgi:DHA1 family tetracycline resistance protein-like MFS transporter